MRSLFALTVRQRICVYLVLAALGGLACAGVDFTIDANRMDIDVPAPSEFDCSLKPSLYQCSSPAVFSNGTCHLKRCARPPETPGLPIANCPFGAKDQGRAWTESACTAKAASAGCSQGTLYSFGCYGYTCTDLRCGKSQ